MLTCAKAETQTGRARSVTLQVASSHWERRVPRKSKRNFQMHVWRLGWGWGCRPHSEEPRTRKLAYTLLKQPGLRDFPDCPRARLLQAPYSFLQILSLSLSSFAVDWGEASLVSVTPSCVEISCADLGTVAVPSPNLPTWMSPEQPSPRGTTARDTCIVILYEQFFFFKLLVEIVTLSAKRNREQHHLPQVEKSLRN